MTRYSRLVASSAITSSLRVLQLYLKLFVSKHAATGITFSSILLLIEPQQMTEYAAPRKFRYLTQVTPKVHPCKHNTSSSQATR